MGLIRAALLAGKNPAMAPAKISIKTVVRATLKFTDGFAIYCVSIKGPTNSSNIKLKMSPIKTAMAVTKMDSCKTITTIDNG